MTDVRLGHVFAGVVDFTEGIIKKKLGQVDFFIQKKNAYTIQQRKKVIMIKIEKERQRETERDKKRQRETVGERGTETKRIMLQNSIVKMEKYVIFSELVKCCKLIFRLLGSILRSSRSLNINYSKTWL